MKIIFPIFRFWKITIRTCVYINIKERESLQGFNFNATHPPDIGIEDKNINISPMFGMVSN